MVNVSFKMLQFRGKIRRLLQTTLMLSRTEAMLAQRKGECNRCGACCKILFRCPFLATDADGQYVCRIYARRFLQCRLYPIQTEDLREVNECSYTFAAEPDGLPEPLPEPEPVSESPFHAIGASNQAGGDRKPAG
jgi:hypothetical protein